MSSFYLLFYFFVFCCKQTKIQQWKKRHTISIVFFKQEDSFYVKQNKFINWVSLVVFTTLCQKSKKNIQLSQNRLVICHLIVKNRSFLSIQLLWAMVCKEASHIVLARANILLLDEVLHRPGGYPGHVCYLKEFVPITFIWIRNHITVLGDPSINLLRQINRKRYFLISQFVPDWRKNRARSKNWEILNWKNIS